MDLIIGSNTVKIDESDYELVSQYTWAVSTQHGIKYAIARNNNGENNRGIGMHRLVMNIGRNNETVVDHIDCDGLNNQKSNLRICSAMQNLCNRRLNKNSKSGYKGVSFSTQRNKWIAVINHNKKRYVLGFFDNPIIAANEYDKAAHELHKEYARTNNINKEKTSFTPIPKRIFEYTQNLLDRDKQIVSYYIKKRNSTRKNESDIKKNVAKKYKLSIRTIYRILKKT